MKPQNIITALSVFKLEIAKLDYAAERYIQDKQTIADSFDSGSLCSSTGYITDPHNGAVWIVYLDGEDYKYQKVN